MAAYEYKIEVIFDAEGFQAELLRRLALTSGTDENIYRIGIELLNEGTFIQIGPEKDLLEAEFLDERKL